MSKMIALSNDTFVAADCVAEVKVNSSSQTLTVRMKDGSAHTHQPGYGESVWSGADKLILEINQALAGKGGEV